jgi:glutamate formiminotransferase/formiminotetrahydrofolate cyclodeaminase
MMVEATFALVTRAVERIDMRRHTGAHPRIGAVDVLPFVPIRGVGLNECVDLAKALGRRVATQLGLPVYYYEEAATAPHRRPLPYLRKGEFEGLADRMGSGAFAPDEGPATPHPSAGILITGARPFLIAYNVHLATTSVITAQQIAFALRSAERAAPREGAVARTPLPAFRAIGWYMEEYGCAEVSCNLLNFEVTGLHAVFTAISTLAKQLGTEVTGSEIIGLVPKKALLDAGRAFLGREEEDAALLTSAVERLGLARMKGFMLEEKVVEAQLRRVGLG